MLALDFDNMVTGAAAGDIVLDSGSEGQLAGLPSVWDTVVCWCQLAV